MAKVCTDPLDLHADGDDDEEVKGSRADNSSGAEISGLELAADDLDDGQQDFRRCLKYFNHLLSCVKHQLGR